MSESGAFSDPKLAINKVYTKTGDKGRTALVGGQRVAKNHRRIEGYGTVDELNAFVGAAICSIHQELSEGDSKRWMLSVLTRIQHELFNLGSILATLPEDVHPLQPRIRPTDIAQLETEIDRANTLLGALRSFVLPGGSRSNADLHICRTVCRRAERLLVPMLEDGELDADSLIYLNRLSDAFFVWSRWVNHELGKAEVLWNPNHGAAT